MLLRSWLAEATLQAIYEATKTVAAVGAGFRERPQMGGRWRC